ncbi:hypothetical protein MRS44_018518 [Fusarium solani]|uniref:uncharacterized protein n=1 Tax=Fusarium solani TaxID=169388 RepID=UPI0032C41203|nr:hypothetical protein MRS44_018518 [Fusarium solani]
MSNVQRTDTTPNPDSSNPLPSKDDKVNSDETPADDPGSNIIYTMSRQQTDTTSRPDGSVPSQASPQTPPPDDNVDGGKGPVDDSGANKEDGVDTEHPHDSKDDDKTETSDLDHVLDEAEKEMTKDMGFK